MIFSYFPVPGDSTTFFKYGGSDGNKYSAHQLLILRFVSRRFRFIINEHDFWIDRDFEFAYLCQCGPWNSSGLRREGAFVSVLFNDDHLVQCLVRKTAWLFTNIETVQVVFENIPRFPENVRELSLEINEVSQYDIIDKLSACYNVTVLKINAGGQTIDLQLIVESFPFLEKLHLENFVHDRRGTGSINDLCYLTDLRVGTCDWSISKFTPNLMPTNSAKRLTRLKIDSPLDTVQAPRLAHSLNSFVNLRHLHVNPLEEIMCDILVGTNIKLQTLQIVIDVSYISPSKYPDIFSAKSLRNLEKLALSLETWGKFNEPNERVILAIIYNLQTLQVLDLEMGLNLSWCRHFARLVNLRMLCWRGILRGYDDSAFEDIAGDIIVPRILRDDGNFKVQYSFALAFAGFPVKPRVKVAWWYEQYRILDLNNM